MALIMMTSTVMMMVMVIGKSKNVVDNSERDFVNPLDLWQSL